MNDERPDDLDAILTALRDDPHIDDDGFTDRVMAMARTMAIAGVGPPPKRSVRTAVLGASAALAAAVGLIAFPGATYLTHAVLDVSRFVADPTVAAPVASLAVVAAIVLAGVGAAVSHDA